MSDHSGSQCQAYLDRATQERIGRELRVIFAEPFGQPLPDKLLGALRAIQDAEKRVNQSKRVAALQQKPGCLTPAYGNVPLTALSEA